MKFPEKRDKLVKILETIKDDDNPVIMIVNLTSQPVNNEIATFQNLAASQLVEAYEKGELKGKLKEIAAELNDESNPVIMLMKYKK